MHAGTPFCTRGIGYAFGGLGCALRRLGGAPEGLGSLPGELEYAPGYPVMHVRGLSCVLEVPCIVLIVVWDPELLPPPPKYIKIYSGLLPVGTATCDA